MKLISDELIQKYESAGLWSNDPASASLDGLLRRNASQSPDQIAFADDPSRNLWDGQEPFAITWSKLNADVEALAGFVAGLGLPESAVVGVCGTNTVETYKTILALHRAGLVAALLPTYWHEYELKSYIENIQAKALITSARLEDNEISLRCRTIAKDLFNIRFVFGFGAFLPDGVVNLDQIINIAATSVSDTTAFDLPDPNDVIAIIPPAALNTGSIIGHAISSNQAFALENTTFGTLNGEITLPLCPYSPSGLAGFLFGLIGGVKNSRTTHLHHFRSENGLDKHIRDIAADFALVPNSLPLPEAESLKYVGLVHKNMHAKEGEKLRDAKNIPSVFDVTILNEIVAIGQMREASKPLPSPMPLGSTFIDVSDLQLTFSKDSFRSDYQAIGEHRPAEIVATGSAVPTPYARTLKPKELERLQEGDVPTRVLGVQPDLTKDYMTLHGMNDEYDIIDGLIVSTDWVDNIYRSLPLVTDAAFFKVEGSTKPHAAFTMNGGVEFDQNALLDGLKALEINPVYLPHDFYECPSIPRDSSGKVDRNLLASDFMATRGEPITFRRAG